MVPVFPFLHLAFAFLPLGLPFLLCGSFNTATTSSTGNPELSLSADWLSVRASFVGVGFADILHMANPSQTLAEPSLLNVNWH
jgi:hypothetical protein